MTWPAVSVLYGGVVQVAQYAPAATFGPRRLNEHEFVWILEGSALWKARRGPGQHDDTSEMSVELRPGILLLAPSGVVDSYQWDRRVPSRHAWAHFRVDDPAQLPTGRWPLVRHLAEAPALSGICSYLLDLAALGTPESRIRTAELMGVLLELFVNGPLEDPQPASSKHVLAAVEAVQQLWRRDGVRIVAADELADASGLSAGHLFRLFRAEYGCGPAQALEFVRLARAAVALQRSNATLAEIARDCGFANAYHFSRRFAAAYGSPPGAFRARAAVADPLAPLRTAGLMRLAHALGVV